MSMISYAQNYEDVMLHRALKDVEKGFYIDVGANDPVIDSVTKAFYDAGWRGINIEPVCEWYEKLQEDRPDDINLQIAVGARKGNINFYEVVGTGLSTTDESVAKRYLEEGCFELKKYKMPVVRLTTICEEHSHSDIHFLKIDVEGGEQSALRGLDLKNIRPWIILVESISPITRVEDHQMWEYLLIDSGYHFVYFDGLSRFYVADEHVRLDAAFVVPPNYFDFFKRAREDWLEHRVEELQDELESNNSARIEQVESLTEMLKESEADRAARLEQVESLTEMLKESESDRAARMEQVESLTEMLKGSESDRAARLEQVESLTEMLKESESDRAARLEQVESLTEMLKESKADRAAMIGQDPALSALNKEFNE